MRTKSDAPSGERPAPHEDATEGAGRRICVIVSRFNRRVTERLLDGAARTLIECGVAEEDMDIVHVPGAWELPLAAREAAAGGYDAIVALGCVIRGETAHFEHVSRAAIDGLARVQLDTGVPVGLGVLTPYHRDQALARAGGELGNAGVEAALAALRMADLRGQRNA
ncbi:6,7-dimethyl-8-ribityllumazine synthase [Candidatus Palauibacter sp.]|uniref:6,7-dimethyl-8-ribityllumazine synthase n=1 Tax=Candidatus Palauibacter sp. TaxID=3101350 RepID=UPI003AF248BA